MSNAPRILIVDQSLKDMAGHHYEYDAALCRAAAAIGVDMIVGAHASVAPLDLLGDKVRPWFKKAWYETQVFSGGGAEGSGVRLASRIRSCPACRCRAAHRRSAQVAGAGIRRRIGR